MKKKLEMEVGKRYKGYCYRNEYGELFFEPEQKGSKAGEVKLIRNGDGFTLSESKNCLIVHINIPKKKRMEMLKNYLIKCDLIFSLMKSYEI